MTSLGPYVSSDDAPRRSATVIVDELRETILELPVGAPLGSEDDLIVRFDVSRPTFRQALRMLQAEGLVEVRRGVKGGMFAASPTSAAAARALSTALRRRGATFTQLTQAMRPVSNEIVRLAAQSTDLDQKQALVDEVRDFDRRDLDERTSVYAVARMAATRIERLADNPVLSVMFEVLGDLSRHDLSGAPSPVGHWEETHDFQLALAEAIRDGDGTRAAELNDSMFVRVAGWLI